MPQTGSKDTSLRHSRSESTRWSFFHFGVQRYGIGVDLGKSCRDLFIQGFFSPKTMAIAPFIQIVLLQESLRKS